MLPLTLGWYNYCCFCYSLFVSNHSYPEHFYPWSVFYINIFWFFVFSITFLLSLLPVALTLWAVTLLYNFFSIFIFLFLTYFDMINFFHSRSKLSLAQNRLFEQTCLREKVAPRAKASSWKNKLSCIFDSSPLK